jgi:hypothetical protein
LGKGNNQERSHQNRKKIEAPARRPLVGLRDHGSRTFKIYRYSKSGPEHRSTHSVGRAGAKAEAPQGKSKQQRREFLVKKENLIEKKSH